jgi:hypothetical protein
MAGSAGRSPAFGLCKFMGPREHAYIEQYNATDEHVRARGVETVHPQSPWFAESGQEGS